MIIIQEMINKYILSPTLYKFYIKLEIKIKIILNLYRVTAFTSVFPFIWICLIPKCSIYVTALTTRSYVSLFTIIYIVNNRTHAIIIIIFTSNYGVGIFAFPPVPWFKEYFISKASLSWAWTQLTNLLRIFDIWFLYWIFIFRARITN